jgi:threonine aldolase
MADIDLRSDTVTRPTAAMRRAIAEAEVGDDVFGDDPTVRALEERVAALLGKEAALFVPSGTMANQLALRAQLRPGDEVMIGKDAHVWRNESGALAALAGAQTRVLPGDGRFEASAVRAAFVPDEPYGSPTRVVAIENTHNASGGTVWDPTAIAEVVAVAHELGMATHLDGARIWNAAIASGRTEKELAAGFDTVSVCLSKGLGAPVGSVVASTRDVIRRCHRFRKMYGGGMRQAGLLAAAGLHAIEHHRARLADDHANARYLAETLAGIAGIRVDAARVETNIVNLEYERADAGGVVAHAASRGVRLLGVGRRMRLVTHLDVDRAGCTRAAEVIADAVARA